MPLISQVLGFVIKIKVLQELDGWLSHKVTEMQTHKPVFIPSAHVKNI